MKIANWLSSIALGTLLFALPGCIEDVDDPAVDTVAQPAWSPGSARLWPSTPIRVCVEAYGDWDESDPRFVARVAETREKLETELATLENTTIAVYGWDVCPPPGTPSLLDTWRATHQDLPGQSDGRASADVGYDPDRETGVSLGVDYPVMGIVHEFAHGIGLAHEFGREDISQPCTGGSEGQQSAADNFFLTAYDHSSIANQTYCGEDEEAKWAGVFSDLDKIAIAFMYPKAELPMAVPAQGIMFGGGYALREDVSLFDMKSEWVARGILESAASIEYCDLGLPLGGDQRGRLGVERTVDMKCHFSDYWGRDRVSQSQVVRSNSKHASVVVAVL